MKEQTNVESWVQDIEFERMSLLRRICRKLLINPLVNYMPAGIMRGILKHTKSELAQANWDDPGGWKSMVMSYEGNPTQIADKFLVNLGAISMALRNRRRLGAKCLTRLFEAKQTEPVYVLCLGAGPGRIIIDAMLAARCDTRATLVDLSDDAFAYGMELAETCGLKDRVKYIQGDVRNVKDILDQSPDVVKMLGICEYLTDEQVVDIAKTLSDIMPEDAAIVFNSISKAHENDRFFRRVMGLHMIHRTPEELQELMRAGGFNSFVTYPEPLGVYHVIVGHRK